MTDSRIRHALERAIELGEVGVQVAAYSGDRLIVDEAIGLADHVAGTPVTSGTLFPAFSVGKAVVATAIHLQAERGLLELDQPVARYWPEFGRRGKANVTIRHVLTHRAGVPQVPDGLELEDLKDWDGIIRFLADQEPLCPPGTKSMYHTITFGYILGEVVRRTDPSGRLFADFVRDEISAPLGITDMWFGLPPERDASVAVLTVGNAPSRLGPPLTAVRARSIGRIRFEPEQFNRSAARRVCFPPAGIILNAVSGARFFSLLATGGLAGGKRLLSRAALLECTQPRPNPSEIDEALGQTTSTGMGGYGTSYTFASGKNGHVLAHGGAGGAIGWADLDSGLAVMINHNRMFGELPTSGHPFAQIALAVESLTREDSRRVASSTK